MRADVLGEDGAADGVDDEVGAVLAGCLHDRGREVGARACTSATSSPSGFERRQLVGRARGADDLRAQHLAQLQRRHADAGGHAVDQQPFAGLQPALQHQHVVRRRGRSAGCWRPLPTTALAGTAMASAASISAYSENAPAQRPITRSPGLKPADLGADRDDLAGAFAADGLPGAGLAVQAVAQHELAAVERRGVHAHQQLLRSRLGHRRLAQFEHRVRCRSSASSRTASSTSPSRVPRGDPASFPAYLNGGPASQLHQRVPDAGRDWTDVVAHERRKHGHRSLILGSHELRIDDQLSTGVLVRSRQLHGQAQLAFGQLARANVEMRSVVLADLVTGELETFPELTYIETIHRVIDFTDGLAQTFEHPNLSTCSAARTPQTTYEYSPTEPRPSFLTQAGSRFGVNSAINREHSSGVNTIAMAAKRV